MTQRDQLNQRRRRYADELNRKYYVGTGIHVCAGDSRGPYSISIDRLSKRDLEKVIQAIMQATGREPKNKEGGTLTDSRTAMPTPPPDRPSEPSVPKLTPRQAEVMRWACGGWTIRGSHGLACEVNGKRVCNRDTIDVLVRLGLLKQVGRWEWMAVKADEPEGE